MLRIYTIAFCLSLGVTVANSFARFAYALVLPAMRSELGWTYAQAGWLNTANAIGYLLGAILTRMVIARSGNRRLFIGGVLLTALSVLATGLTHDLYWLGVWRLLSGVTGAAAFIAGGALSGNVAPERPHTSATTVAIFFAGGGIGFLLCGVAIPLLLDAAGPSAWPRAWAAMGWAGLAMFTVAAWAALRIAEPNSAPAGQPAESPVQNGERLLRAGLVAYTLFGVGYIGYMTFIIAWMRDYGASTGDVISVWVAFGLAGLVGPWLWRRPLRTWIPGRMLAAALAMLALGALLPLLTTNLAAMLASAMLFGASMWNVPVSVTNLAKRALPKPAWGGAVATFTIVFAAGQILGPVLTGALADAFGSLRVGLAVSVAVLGFGAAIALLQRDVTA